MHLQQFDIGTTFLNGDLVEEIYMTQLQGYVDLTKPKHYCRLKKSLYGLRQSARQWNQHFSKFLKQFRLITSEADCCVYSNDGELHTLLGIYVDDGIISSTNPVYVESILKYLESTFKVTCGSMDYFIGFQIQRCPLTSSIFVHQSRYIQDVLLHFGLHDAHEVSTPADPHAKLSKTTDPNDPPIDVPYRQGVGCLMYASIITRPDIAYAVGKVSLFQERSHQSHWTVVKRIMRYLKRTQSFGLYYSGQSPPPRLLGYSDADYGGDLDDRKSCTGFVYTLGSTAITWGSHKQGCFADSTTIAKLVAMAESTKESIWLCRLLRTLNCTQTLPLTIYYDNQATIALVKNPEYHKRTKHVDMKYYAIRTYYEDKLLEFTYIHTSEQVADILTKALPRDIFQRLRRLMGVRTFNENEWESDDVHSS